MKTVHTILVPLVALLAAGCATQNYSLTQATAMTEPFRHEIASAKAVSVVFDGHENRICRNNIISALAKHGVEQNSSNYDILIKINYPLPKQSRQRVIVGGYGVDSTLNQRIVPDEIREKDVWTTVVTITATDTTGASFSEAMLTDPVDSYAICDAIAQQWLERHKLWQLVGASRK